MKLLILDSSYLIYKSYFAFKNRHLTVTKENEEIITSAVFGFVREIISLSESEKYDLIISAWDSPPYIKKQKYPSYKANRDKKDLPSFSQEKEIIQGILYDLKIPCLFSYGYEGEEVAKKIISRFKEHTIDLYTNDEDCYALLRSNVSLIRTLKAEIIKFTKKDLLKKYNVTPKQFRTFKALTGCVSDNVQGANGIGPVKASWLANHYGSLSQIKRSLDEIKLENKDIHSKLVKPFKDKTLKASKFLTTIESPKKLFCISQNDDLSYTDILEYIEARTLLRGRNKLALKAIKKKQRKLFKQIRKQIQWKNVEKQL